MKGRDVTWYMRDLKTAALESNGVPILSALTAVLWNPACDRSCPRKGPYSYCVQSCQQVRLRAEETWERDEVGREKDSSERHELMYAPHR